MGILDYHVVIDGTGATGGLGGNFTVAVNDGASVAGVPIANDAVLKLWSISTTIADTIEEAKMTSQDQVDPINGEDYLLGAASLAGIVIGNTHLPYRTGARRFQIDQNTAAAACNASMLDYYARSGTSVPLRKQTGNRIVSVQIAGGALTANQWRATAFAPTIAIPNGVYALHGAWVSAHTNFGHVRFSHADFQGKKPGFPVADMTNTAVANAVLPKDELILQQGYQFDYLSELVGAPCCPVFTITNAGTGLSVENLSITADTPRTLLNLSKIG